MWFVREPRIRRLACENSSIVTIRFAPMWSARWNPHQRISQFLLPFFAEETILLIMITTLFLLVSLPLVRAYINIGISCQEFLVDDASELVCAHHEEQGPSIAAVNDTHVEYVGDYIDKYDILDLDMNMTLEEVESLMTTYYDYLAGFTIQVTRFTEKEGCEVSLNGTLCSNCEVCEGNTTAISVDCSVTPGGRIVECEPLDDVFFPLEGYSLVPTTDGADDEIPTTADGNFTSSGTPEEPSDGGSKQTVGIFLSFILASLTIFSQYFN